MSYKQKIKEIEARTQDITQTPSYQDVLDMYRVADTEVNELFDLVQEMRGTLSLYQNNKINSKSEVDMLLERVDYKINGYIVNTSKNG